MELFEKKSEGMSVPQKTSNDTTAQRLIKPTIVGGLFLGATFRTAKNGARVEIFPTGDLTVGIESYDANGDPVFTTKILGDDIGDVILGNLGVSKYVKWDASLATLVINGVSLSDFVSTNIATGSDLALQKWTSDLIFSATNYRVVAWTSGTLRFTSGDLFSIAAGNTGNMGATTYIYFDKAVSLTALQTSTNPVNSVGANKVLIGVAMPNASTSHRATYQIYSGTGGVIVSVDDLAANDSSTNEFITNAAEISNGLITYAKIQNVTDARLLGRSSGSAGPPIEITVGTGLSLSGGSLTNPVTQFTNEMVDDEVAALIQNGTGITWSYDDSGNKLTPTVTITQYTDALAQAAQIGLVIQKLSTTSAIDAKTVATTSLYTVPAGKTAIITKAVTRVTAATAITVVPTLGIGVAAGEDDIFASVPLTGLDATTKVYAFSATGTYVSVATGGVIKLGIDVGATATTMTIAVDLIGYLI